MQGCAEPARGQRHPRDAQQLVSSAQDPGAQTKRQRTKREKNKKKRKPRQKKRVRTLGDLLVATVDLGNLLLDELVTLLADVDDLGTRSAELLDGS